MRVAVAFLILLSVACLPSAGQRRGYDFSGVWKLEIPGADARSATHLHLSMEGNALTGELNTPYGKFPLENGHAEGDDVFFNVVVERDEYRLKTTYRGHRFGEEIQFSVEAGERTLQVIARRDS